MTRPTVTVREIGREREPIAIIDDFVPEPDTLRTFAAGQAYGPAGQYYPGIKAPLPDEYLRMQGPLIGTVLREVFGVTGRVGLLEARFSIVTVPPAALSLEQRLPHFDAIDRGQSALVHYLVPEGTEGTAFYRHRSTGFETVGEARVTNYLATLNRELQRTGMIPTDYVAGDTPLFEQIASVPGAYNRALLYRGHLLHSGVIPAGAALPADPVTGRLTVTGFFTS